MTKNNDAVMRLMKYFEADDPMMMFYKHRGRKRFLHYCIWGDYDSYSVFVGSWKGVPPGEPTFTKIIEYRFGEDEGNKWQKMVDKLHAEAVAAGAVSWDNVTDQSRGNVP